MDLISKALRYDPTARGPQFYLPPTRTISAFTP